MKTERLKKENTAANNNQWLQLYHLHLLLKKHIFSLKKKQWIRFGDVSPNLMLESKVGSVINLIKDPVLWEINDSVREIIARKGFDQNKSCDFLTSEKIYADQRRF